MTDDYFNALLSKAQEFYKWTKDQGCTNSEIIAICPLVVGLAIKASGINPHEDKLSLTFAVSNETTRRVLRGEMRPIGKPI